MHAYKTLKNSIIIISSLMLVLLYHRYRDDHHPSSSSSSSSVSHDFSNEWWCLYFQLGTLWLSLVESSAKTGPQDLTRPAAPKIFLVKSRLSLCIAPPSPTVWLEDSCPSGQCDELIRSGQGVELIGSDQWIDLMWSDWKRSGQSTLSDQFSGLN